MKRLSTIAAALLLLSSVTAAANPVQTGAGLVEGARAGGLTVYKGVPFAAPPLGALRWREPAPVPPWSGVRKADAFAPACMQTGVSMPGETPPVVSEDCLYLNIWTRAKAANAKLPVIVWIYGGGFFNGSAAMPLYWGDRLARRGAIVVTFGYRVGPFGFLAHPALTAESPHHSSGNYGLGSDRGASMGETQHRRLRGRPCARDDRRPVGRRRIGEHIDGVAIGEGIVHARHRRKRRHVRAPEAGAELSARQRRA